MLGYICVYRVIYIYIHTSTVGSRMYLQVLHLEGWLGGVVRCDTMMRCPVLRYDAHAATRDR